MANQVKKIVDNLQKIGNNLIHFATSAHEKFQPALESLEKFGKLLYTYFEKKEKLALLLLENEWPPLQYMLPRDISLLLSMNESMSSKEFSEYIKNYIIELVDDEYLNYLNQNWIDNPLLSNRLKVIDEAVSCHKDGKYYASTIIFLSQIEGMLANGFHHIGTMNGKQFKKYVEKLLAEGKSNDDIALKEFIISKVLVQFQHGSLIGSDISRHAIMHGADVKYGTLINSIKALLLFDYLQDCFGYVKLYKSNTYHIHGCHHLRNSSKTYELVKHVGTFEQAGYKACKSCIGYN